MNRRELIRLATLSAGLQALSHRAYSQIAVKANPFKLGVASGSPTPDGMVLWTKLVSDSLLGWGEQAIEVTWQVAHDEQFEASLRAAQRLRWPSSAMRFTLSCGACRPIAGTFIALFTVMALMPRSAM